MVAGYAAWGPQLRRELRRQRLTALRIQAVRLRSQLRRSPARWTAELHQKLRRVEDQISILTIQVGE